MDGTNLPTNTGSTPVPPKPILPTLEDDDLNITTTSSGNTSNPSTPAILATPSGRKHCCGVLVGSLKYRIKFILSSFNIHYVKLHRKVCRFPIKDFKQILFSADASPQLSGTPTESAAENETVGIFGITPVYRQRIPANVKSAMIVDTNGDGFNELIVTLTDRVVRTYQWHHTGDIISMEPHGHLMPKNKWEFASQVSSLHFFFHMSVFVLLFSWKHIGLFVFVRKNQFNFSTISGRHYYASSRRSRPSSSSDFSARSNFSKTSASFKLIKLFYPIVRMSASMEVYPTPRWAIAT